MGLRLSTKEDLKCKHCGFVKERLDLYCYFAWNGGQWSDRRELAPNQAVPALVQYCPNCHRFYYIDAEGKINICLCETKFVGGAANAKSSLVEDIVGITSCHTTTTEKEHSFCCEI